MKVIICNRPGDLAVVDRATPTRAANEVLLRIRRIGLCGTDYHILAGNQPYLNYPRVMGHELAAEVVEAPEGSSLRVGEAVTVNPYIACGCCIACRKDKPNCCAAISVMGVHADGGMAEYLSVPASAVLPVGDLTLDQAAMVEFLAVGAHAVRRAALSAVDRVLVVGAGPIGVAVALFAGLDGADVTLIDTSPARLAHARDAVGISQVLTVDAGIDAALAARTDGEFYDAVFDATGNIHAMRKGLAYVAHGGRYVLVSVVKDDLVFPDPEFHKRETTLIGSRNATQQDFARVIAAIAAGAIPTAALQTHAFPAIDLPTRMPQLMADPGSVLKAIASF